MAGYNSTKDTRKPGDVDVKKATIFTHDRKRRFDISFQLVSLKIYEDIFKNTMYGTVTFIDRMNSLQELPILGEEFFEVEFENPNIIGKKFSANFFIYAVSDVVPAEDRKSQLVTLHFISAEHLENAKKLVSYAFKNDSFSNHVKRLLTDSVFLGSKIPVARWTDSTGSKGTFTFPYQSCFEIIEYFRLNAYKFDDPSSAYVFFQNQNGFNFTTIDDLIRNPVNKDDVVVLRHYSVSQVNPREQSAEDVINTAQAVVYNNINDTLESMKRGVFTSQTTIFDFPYKSTSTRDYKIASDFNTFAHLDDGLGLDPRFRTANRKQAGPKNSNYFIEEISKATSGIGSGADPAIYVGRNFLFPENSDRGVTGILDFAARRSAYNEMLQQLPLTIQMFGNPKLTAGAVVELLIPTVTHNTVEMHKDEMSKYISGRFLIGRVCHTIEVDTYKMTLNIFKESYKERINPTDPFYNVGGVGPRFGGPI